MCKIPKMEYIELWNWWKDYSSKKLEIEPSDFASISYEHKET